MPTPEEQSRMTYGELFKLNSQKAAIRSGIFIAIFGGGLYVITGETLSPVIACIFFLIDASVGTWKHKWFGRKK